MKIGLLAYHAACNFGAFLQLLSTVEYVRKRGDEPRVINWIPKDFREYYATASISEVRCLYEKMQRQYFPLTDLCETPQEVANVIEKEKISSVLVGSDAVLQHHPLLERIYFPAKTIFYIGHPTSDRMYPNCFWGQFAEYLEWKIPMAVISGSSQDSKYFYIKGRTKKKMKTSVMSFKYLSVRDEWTRKMIEYLTDGELEPEVTPDPVFAFNNNAGHLLPSKKDLLERLSIPEDYFLISFKGSKSVNQSWINEFQDLSNKKGIACVKLPYADSEAYGDVQFSVGNIISPLDWYSLIKYSKGYVGNNMHPIVTSIHNGVPFFSFDNYGIAKVKGHYTNGESSKVYHLLAMAGLLDYRVFIKGQSYTPPTPEKVFESLLAFKLDKELDFAKNYYCNYLTMMEKACKAIIG